MTDTRVNAYLVAGGKYHDIDSARLELLKLLAEHPHVRVTVAADYEDTQAITAADFLVSYTCDVRPSVEAQNALRAWVDGGARWLALHGTNSALDLGMPNGVEAPRCFPVWAETLGSQFVAHPPIMPFRVDVVDDSDWLVAGIEPFETDDELYICEYADRAALKPLLATHYLGTARGFAESDWTTGSGEHLVMYRRPLGKGEVLYNNLGHCRGHYDMVPMVPYYPNVERGSWAVPQYYEILRRALRWALGHTA